MVGLTVELYENKAENYWVIKDGEAVLKLSEDEFNAMKKDGRSPLLKKLYDQARKERQQN
ncbi:MAG: hypothetical protein GF414_00750 [Candidatus Altiarchaeales archaeon]|nr:hypothetical protein [Candidatus Altiarchaeales archaeon]